MSACAECGEPLVEGDDRNGETGNHLSCEADRRGAAEWPELPQ